MAEGRSGVEKRDGASEEEEEGGGQRWKGAVVSDE